MLRLIQKWLKAGVSEDGEWSETKVGTPQGAVISPLLANIYLHLRTRPMGDGVAQAKRVWGRGDSPLRG
jgi:retron-type reverse transcriptase